MHLSRCPYCHGRDAVHAHRRGDGAVVVCCKDCGLLYLEDIPSDPLSPYDDTYFDKDAKTGAHPKAGYTTYAALDLGDFRWQLALLRLFDAGLADHGSSGRSSVLDIGCATGRFMSLANEAGYDPTGIEMISAAVSVARRAGLRVVDRPLESAEVEGPFDAVTAWELIEHVASPAMPLARARDLMRPGGLLLISTPDAGDRHAREHGDAWLGYHSSYEHLTFLTAEVLERALGDTFEVAPIVASFDAHWTPQSTLVGIVRKGGLTERDLEIGNLLRTGAVPRDPELLRQIGEDLGWLHLHFCAFDALADLTRALRDAGMEESADLLLACTKILRWDYEGAAPILRDLARHASPSSPVWLWSARLERGLRAQQRKTAAAAHDELKASADALVEKTCELQVVAEDARTQNTALRTENADLRKQGEDLREQLEEERAHNEDLREQLEEERAQNEELQQTASEVSAELHDVNAALVAAREEKARADVHLDALASIRASVWWKPMNAYVGLKMRYPYLGRIESRAMRALRLRNAPTADAPSAPRPASPDARRWITELERFAAKRQGRPIAVVWAAVTPTESEGQRPFRMSQAFVDLGVSVIYVSWTWAETDLPRQGEVWPDFFVISRSRFLELFAQAGLEPLLGTSGKRWLLLTYPDPAVLPILARANAHAHVTAYDVLDDWEHFANVGQADWYDPAAEQFALRNAQRVTVVSALLAKKHAAHGPESLPNGFSAKGLVDSPRADVARGALTVGYFGYLTEAWFDWKLVIATARANPDMMFHIIGYGEPEGLRLPSNVVLLGRAPPHRLSGYSKNWDVCVIPFRAGDLAEAADPIKLYEYLYLQRPVVATGMPQLAGIPNVTCSANEPGAFASALRRAVSGAFDQPGVETFLANATWSSRAQVILAKPARA